MDEPLTGTKRKTYLCAPLLRKSIGWSLLMAGIAFCFPFSIEFQNIMKTLVIYSHSYQEQSVSNRAILEVLATETDYAIRNLEQLYPDGRIDVAAEQQALLEADVIVLQHPLFWYSVPSLMKRWMDEVFAFGFAYGLSPEEGGSRLAGKRLVHSFTAAAGPEDFTPEMLAASTGPLRMACRFCSLTYAGCVHSLGLLSVTNPNCRAEAQVHAHRLVAHIESLEQK